MSSDLAKYEFVRHRISEAVAAVRDVLESNRTFVQPDAVQLIYADKFSLTESATSCCLLRAILVLKLLGMSDEYMQTAIHLADKSAVKLRATVENMCEFVNETSEMVQVGPQITTTKTSPVKGTKSETTEVHQKVTTYHWRMKQVLSVSIYAGYQAETSKAQLMQRSIEMDLSTKVKEDPRKSQPRITQHVCDLSYLFKHSPNGSPVFQIDRSNAKCHTPVYNPDIIECIEFFQQFFGWVSAVFGVFNNDTFRMEQSRSQVNLNELLRPLEQTCPPVLPLLETLADDSVHHLQAQDFQRIGECFEKSMLEGPKVLAHVLKKEDAIAFHQIGIIVAHGMLIYRDFIAIVEYMRGLIAKQLVSAIGKQVTATDLNEFSVFHNKKIFKSEFVPKALCHDVRREGFTPDGVISLNYSFPGSDGCAASISTIQRQVLEPTALKMSLGSSTTIKLKGSHFLCGYIAHQFSTEAFPTYEFNARAREFSAFVIIIGTIGQESTFECKEAMLVQNKDHVIIPLLFETIPSAAEFRDAISSLSPEQQRFAKAFREMQISSTIFAIAVVQIKPQLEKVLKLPPDSLTKEIGLTQDLMELFIEYQIPSDLLSYTGAENASVSDKIQAVKSYAASVREAIVKPTRDKEQEERLSQAELKKKEQNSSFGGYGYSSTSPAYFPTSPAQGFLASAASQGEGCMPSDEPVLIGHAGLIKRMAFGAAPPPMPAPTPSASMSSMPPMVTATAPQPTVQPTETTHATEDFEMMPSGQKVDYAKIPHMIESSFELLDKECNIRPTKIKTLPCWKFSSYDRLKKSANTKVITSSDEMSKSKQVVMDLLDALTRSGEIAVDDCSVHVVYASTHCFDKTVFDTIVCDNINPVERIERSVLVMAKTIMGVDKVDELIVDRERERIESFSPMLFDACRN